MGCIVGLAVGRRVGKAEGFAVVGTAVGRAVGEGDGLVVVGEIVGFEVVGTAVGVNWEKGLE